MLAIIFLLSIFLNGNFFAKRFFEKRIIFADSFLTGSVFGVSFIYLLLFFLHSLNLSIVIYFLLSGVVYVKEYSDGLKTDSNSVKNTVLFLAAVLISYALFEKSFSYSNSTFLIQSNLYQDMGAHIPVIRYFSSGSNFLPEVPFFAGKNLLYHFMFDFYNGILEFLGVRIDTAFNLFSAISLVSLFCVIISISKFLFKTSVVGIIGCVLLILNSDLSFINLFSMYGLSLQGLISIYHHNTYPIGNILGLIMDYNFLNINVFLNQRQLIFGLLYVFYITYLFLSSEKLKKSQIIFLAIFVGLMPFWHIPALISVYLIFAALFVFFKDRRKEIVQIILVSLIFTLPQLLLIKQNSVNHITFNPGFLVSKSLSPKSFIYFWIWNLGFTIPVVIFAFFKSKSFQRKIFLSFMILFIVANLFQFSIEIYDNHKFFNIWIIAIDIFAAYGLHLLFRGKLAVKLVAFVLCLLMIISGAFHLLVVKNDIYAKIPDPKNYNFTKKLNKSAIYITNGDIYDPASLAGFRTFLGRIQHIYSYGGNANERIIERKQILNGENNSEVKKILQKSQIKYIIIYKDQKIPNLISSDTKKLNQTYKKIYEDDFAIIYKI